MNPKTLAEEVFDFFTSLVDKGIDRKDVINLAGQYIQARILSNAIPKDSDDNAPWKE